MKVSQNDQIQMQTSFTSGLLMNGTELRSFLMNGTELRCFIHFQIKKKIGYPYLSRKLENWLFLEFFLIHCKTVKVSHNDQIQMQTWFTKWFVDEWYRIKKF